MQPHSYDGSPFRLGLRLARLRGALAAAAFVGGLSAPATAQTPAEIGQWSAPANWPTLATHMHLLPNGRVLAFSSTSSTRRPKLWNPADGTFQNTPAPANNMLCSGHSFLADGRLLFTGGQVSPHFGVRNASIYDYRTNTWTRVADMNAPRWYPTNCTVKDGRVLVVGGEKAGEGDHNLTPQVWNNGNWRWLAALPFTPPLYPWLHLAPNGQVFFSGPAGLRSDNTQDWQTRYVELAQGN